MTNVPDAGAGSPHRTYVNPLVYKAKARKVNQNPNALSEPKRPASRQLTPGANVPILGPMDVRTETAGHDGQILVVHLPSAVNHVSADGIRSAVERALPSRDDAGLVLDASRVTLITSVGIAMLLQLQEMCDDRRIGLLLISLVSPVRRMLELLRLDARFGIAADLDEAVAHIEDR